MPRKVLLKVPPTITTSTILMIWQNKLECLYPQHIFSQVLNLRIRQNLNLCREKFCPRYHLQSLFQTILMIWQNKLECLYPLYIFSQVLNLRIRQNLNLCREKFFPRYHLQSLFQTIFTPSLMIRKNKLECLSPQHIFSQVLNLRIRQNLNLC